MVDMEEVMDEVDGGVRVVVFDIFRNVSGGGLYIMWVFYGMGWVGGRFGSGTILLLGGGTGWGLHKPFGLLTTHGLDGPGGGTIVVFRGLRGVVRTRDQVRDGVGADGEQLAAAMARFTMPIVDIVFTVEAKLDGGVTVDRGAEGRSEEGGEGDRKEGEHDGWGVGVWVWVGVWVGGCG